MRYTRQILALLALAAGWVVLVADSVQDPCQDFGPRENFEIQYEFQTNCMGEVTSGRLNLHNGNELTCYWGTWEEKEEEGRTEVAESMLNEIKQQGLNVRSVEIIYQRPKKKYIPVGFNFWIIGEPVQQPLETTDEPATEIGEPATETDEPVDAPNNPDTTVPTFFCKDARTHKTLAVDKNYLCENRKNPSETCELKLTYLPNE